jgi:hypothetical protein
MQQLKPFHRNFASQVGHAGEIAAGPGQAVDKTQLNGVAPDKKHDWDGSRGGFGGECRRRAATRENDVDPTVDQVGRKRR